MVKPQDLSGGQDGIEQVELVDRSVEIGVLRPATAAQIVVHATDIRGVPSTWRGAHEGTVEIEHPIATIRRDGPGGMPPNTIIDSYAQWIQKVNIRHIIFLKVGDYGVI